MTARAHVTLRIAAILWIAAMALLPRAGQTASKPAAEAPAAAAQTARQARVLLPSSHGAALATR